MALASTVARVLLGIFFTVFGLNGFLRFIPLPPEPDLATQFIGMLETSRYMAPVFLIQLAGGSILLSGRYTPLGLTLLAPILVNILIFHLTMDQAGILPGAIAMLLWLFVAWNNRTSFAGLLASRSVSPA